MEGDMSDFRVVWVVDVTDVGTPQEAAFEARLLMGEIALGKAGVDFEVMPAEVALTKNWPYVMQGETVEIAGGGDELGK